MTIEPDADIRLLNLHESWAALADGLHAQRLVLHLGQREEVLSSPPAGVGLFSQVSPADLATAPSLLAASEARGWVDRAGLAGWLELPVRYGLAAGEGSPLSTSAAQVTDELLEGSGQDAGQVAVAAVCAASAWWIGAFATIRHLGVHHLTLEPVTDDVTLETLQEAVRIVAIGTATRVLGYRLRSHPHTEGLQLAYCRAIAEGILAEQRLPGLLMRLGELRLVDLVSTSIPWRGQFIKYAGGTGAGQVE